MSRLTEKEIVLALEKLKKYQQYAKTYSAEAFNYQRFRERYLNYLYTGKNLDVFLFAEIQAFRRSKKRNRRADC